MRIPFDIKYRPQIESGEYKVETRSGLPVRIVCWNRKSKNMEILALVYEEHIDEDNEDLVEAALNGRMFPRGKDHDYDLFIVTPMSEFEMKVSEFAEAYGLAATDCESEEYKACNGNLQLIIDKYATELLAIAKKEALKDLPRSEDKEMTIKTGDRVLIHCKSTRDKTHKHIFDNQEGEVLHVWDLKGNPWGNIHVTIEGGYNDGFLLEELEKLPRFKED